jgi:hypothetical protein
VGRASNRKKARRQGTQKSPRSRPGLGPDAAPRTSDQARLGSAPDSALQQDLLHALAGLNAMTDEFRERKERVAVARREWRGNGESVPAEVPPWPEGSLGARLLGNSYLEQARNAPDLLAVSVPDAAVIAADFGHWNVAVGTLARAVVFDRLAVDHPAVSTLIDALAPAVEAELAYGEVIESPLHRGWSEYGRGERGFPEGEGPVFLLGANALVDATWALVGTDPLREVLPVMRSAVAEAAPDLDSEAVANALVGALAAHYRCEQPGDAEALERIGRDVPGDPLEHLVATHAVPPGAVLRAGLTVLAALTRLCMSGSASVLARSRSPTEGMA